MRWSFASVALIVLGLTGVAVIMLFQQITTNNENDYYLLKEVTEAAMIDAIDISYYRDTGNLKIVKEKFVENFTRRFAESTVFVSNDYNINFYDIMETPPKVSIIINTGIGEYTIHGDSNDYNITNKIDAILEYNGKYTDVSITNPYYGNPYISKKITMDYYAILMKGDSGNLSLKVPSELTDSNLKNIRIGDVKYIGVINNQAEFNMALLNNELSYNNVIMDIEDYMQNINQYDHNINNSNLSYYNCDEKSGVFINDYKCNDINKYYVSIKGNVYNKVVIKYNVTWLYDEYDF